DWAVSTRIFVVQLLAIDVRERHAVLLCKVSCNLGRYLLPHATGATRTGAPGSRLGVNLGAESAGMHGARISSNIQVF
ncbi:MAG: hypothetical protein ACTS5V_12155, partial [Giesbergeria sp.]